MQLVSAATSTIDEQVQRLAVLLARGRVGVGAAMLAAAGPLARLSLGSSEPGARAAARLAGGRDLALGLGALTSVRESAHGPEWISMGALVDGIDAVVLLVTPRLPLRCRLFGVVAGASAVVGLLTARRLTDAQGARAVAQPAAEAPDPAGGSSAATASTTRSG